MLYALLDNQEYRIGCNISSLFEDPAYSRVGLNAMKGGFHGSGETFVLEQTSEPRDNECKCIFLYIVAGVVLIGYIFTFTLNSTIRMVSKPFYNYRFKQCLEESWYSQ